MTTSAELEIPTVTVSPGGEATTTLTVRNDTDIVEAYTFEVVGDCAPWSTVEPARVSLYPGTSETVTIRLAPPRSSDVRAGEVPLGVRVLPAERPEAVRVPETTVTVTPFHELRAELTPRRRRGLLRARYRTSVQNLGNTPVGIVFAADQAGEDLTFDFAPSNPHLAPGESTEVRLRARAGKPVWFGQPVTWPFEVAVDRGEESVLADRKQTEQRTTLEGEFVQLVIFPKWLLIVLAALLALLLAWFALVRPAVRSAAKEAADDRAKENAAAAREAGDSDGDGVPDAQEKGGGQGQQGQEGAGQNGGGGGGSGNAATSSGVPGTGSQTSETIDIRTGGGAENDGTYRVPEGKVFGVTDMVVANYQGDEGLLTVTFGERKITTIALETFRNQDYHWVTPIEVTEGQTVRASVTCEKTGTPASGDRASECNEVVNVTGILSDIRR
ncbi:COG1470 family protein [Streptomyces daliensis]|uniref:Hydrolytic protein n=1 Tax=Streptomyces daliensis TaxID=299421 RepID=A0A8T4IX72_9ACTN|nr:hydrolytic protein [Streptomyces daliensis]